MNEKSLYFIHHCYHKISSLNPNKLYWQVIHHLPHYDELGKLEQLINLLHKGLAKTNLKWIFYNIDKMITLEPEIRTNMLHFQWAAQIYIVYSLCLKTNPTFQLVIAISILKLRLSNSTNVLQVLDFCSSFS